MKGAISLSFYPCSLLQPLFPLSLRGFKLPSPSFTLDALFVLGF
jgi:hypothetical protein